MDDEPAPRTDDDGAGFALPSSAEVIVFPDDPVFPGEVAYSSGGGLIYWDLSYVWDRMEARGVTGTATRLCNVGVQRACASLSSGHLYLRGSNVRRRRS